MVATDAVSESGVLLAAGNWSWSHVPSAQVGVKGIIVLIIDNASSADVITGVSYGGVPMKRVGFAINTVEAGTVYSYFLGTGIPQGTQTVLVSTASTDSVAGVAISLLADGDTALAGDATSISATIANPTMFIPGVSTQQVVCASVMHSAANAPNLTPGTGFSDLTVPGGLSLAVDFGTQTGDFEYGRSTAAQNPGGREEVDWAANSTGVAGLALAVTDVGRASRRPSMFGRPRGLHGYDGPEVSIRT